MRPCVRSSTRRRARPGPTSTRPAGRARPTALLLLGHGASGGTEHSRPAGDSRCRRSPRASSVARITQPHVAAGRRVAGAGPAAGRGLARGHRARRRPDRAARVAAHPRRPLGRRPRRLPHRGGDAARPRSSRWPSRCTRRAGPRRAGWTSWRCRACRCWSCRAIATRSECRRPRAGRTVRVIAGADHSLRKDPAAVAAAVVDFVTSLLGRARVEE